MSTVAMFGEESSSQLKYNPIIDNTFYQNYTASEELGSFLSRPVLIKTVTVNELTDTSFNVAPWDAFFNDTRIKKKLDNYSLLSCNLNIKIIVNASPFYYGLFLVDYQPLTTFTPSTIKSLATYSDDLIPRSQRPHLWLYPQTCSGGDMVLPFFYYKNWLRVNNRADFQAMGTLSFTTAVQLLNANSVAGTGMSVQMYAWASDVRVSAPTVALALQSGEEKTIDEYTHNGPISKVASTIADITYTLGSIPIIGKYFKASSAVAMGVANGASVLGFTNVPVIDPVEPFKNQPFPGLASSEISVPIDKLAIDPKNELSVDPRIVGLSGCDEMDISYLVQKESYLGNVSWTAANLVDDLLFGANVVPEMSLHNGVFRNAAPMAHLQHMFRFWRGDIIFRFKIICSKYHRGRLRITWDPEGDIVTDSVSSSVAFTKIVDITEEVDFEVRVPYMQTTPWLRTLDTLQTEYWGGSSYTYNRLLGQSNGMLTIRCFTLQTSPVASAPVFISVFVRGAENLEFSTPKEMPRNTTYFDLQSGEELSYESPSVFEIPHESNPDDSLVCMGEVVRNTRTLLRRSSLSAIRALGINEDSRCILYTSTMSRFPLYRGYDANGVDSAKGTLVPASNFSYNFVFVTPYNWLAPCFVGRRGSSMWHVNTNSATTMTHMRALRYQNTQNSGDYYGRSVSTLPGSFQNSAYARFFVANMQSGNTGEALTNQRTQTGLSVYLPMYSRYRMQTTGYLLETKGTSVDDSDIDRWRLENLTPATSAAGNDISSTYVEYHHSVGTDFSLLFFLNVPTMIILSDPNPAT